MLVGDLVPLMYRARGPWPGLSGDVVAREARDGLGSWEEQGSVEVAPDGAWRAEVTGPDGDREVLAGDAGDGQVPFPDLMVPLMLPWLLLPDFDLEVNGQGEFLGRVVAAVTGSPRLAGPRQRERVSGLVDAELGIFLRYRREYRGRTDSAEFTRLTPGRQGPAGPLPLADAEVNLVYRADLGPQRFSAKLAERTNRATMMRLARESFAAAERGSKARWLWRPSDDHLFDDAGRAARLAVAMPGRYLIEAITDPGSGPARVCCDGQRLWRAYRDRVAVRGAEPPRRAVAAILDPAWLLREPTGLTVLGDAVVDGRAALHVTAGCRALPGQLAPLSGGPVLADRIEAFIDRALGICLRLDGSYQGHRVLRAELSGLSTEVDEAAFGFEPPPGMPVITGGLLAEVGLSPAGLALQAAKGAAAIAFEAGRRWLSRRDTADPGALYKQSPAGRPKRLPDVRERPSRAADAARLAASGGTPEWVSRAAFVRPQGDRRIAQLEALLTSPPRQYEEMRPVFLQSRPSRLTNTRA